ncbi:MAG: hypothetical protein Kow0045_21420 [Albidovulum sp.]
MRSDGADITEEATSGRTLDRDLTLIVPPGTRPIGRNQPIDLARQAERKIAEQKGCETNRGSD